MIVIVKPEASAAQLEQLLNRIRELGLTPMVSQGAERTVVGLIGDERLVGDGVLESLPAVEQVMPILKPYKLVSREFKKTDSIVEVRGIPFGGPEIQVIAGPCSVETAEQMRQAAAAVRAAGCRLMRGGAFKPRTSPYTFQGVGDEGLDFFREAADAYDLPIVTELMDVRKIDVFLEKRVDVIQIGTRNMQNFDLLKEVGRLNVPVILKRGMSATIKEWLMAAEYIAAHGNHRIIFAERGIRTFETQYRNVLDVTAIPVLKKETHLPVIVDPSHAGGKAALVAPLAKAAIAAGADGLLIESHPCPEEAWCDADQALSPEQLTQLMGELRRVAEAVGRTL
ncbi:3-deoxy-7-phosphoheptulonate synthase [Acidithiobacillus caldus]|jgi:3-deoxy-7-phosphoheptulonate synthase|uniref:2-keto-3-deoxy-D-arabino-heptulosonate-7-phosphate synthase I beta n=3 Tax=Acidithiobacillus caldus TaxID=33059 RepID=F9ZNN8_ACICS|nr:3-deoxy-7-phosphoheptulonate synthase [Acidithiobacillus caldus]AEK58039.1 2-keto-3-deoxy-D-arabino-heptulosonate-7- phosphate synthase I beta [Acidithiobacillus caldus SM-1]AIA55026.1 2-keto-3-deoxy-D-arabino-heptulosonate-7-phosphate synthase I beta [Acidithiobacillus caldus ATCC 51756]AUW32697.1 3-deoxy-7-phosphoheptulonate synthase [Acidithiobacillus caldus]MBU2729170.1 3-deoxy-7-phosphoheptulonate synthase [Acidithiobacillus caldus]MBU2734167.1 3-deoxy-7-phosphoheptulonate synthase [Ac